MERQIKKLEFRISIYLPLAWVFVFGALVPLSYVAIVVLGNGQYWHEAELGSFVGGVSGTLAALAGVFFVYVAFLGQRISIIQQQIELQDNRKELQETREEIKGQKEQLKLQNKQFQIQSFNDVFFKLYDIFKNQSEINLYSKLGDEPLINKMKDFIINMKNENPLFNHRKLSNSELIEIISEIFEKSFKGGSARLNGIISNSIAILIHIEQNRHLIDREYYLSIFKNGLTIHEERILFYSFWSDEYLLPDQEEEILRDFLQKLPSNHLLHSSHRKLIM